MKVATCTSERFGQALSAFTAGFAVSPPVDHRGGGERRRGETIEGIVDPVAEYMIGQALVRNVGPGGELWTPCPWSASHSCDSGPSETAYLPAGTNGRHSAGFRCMHASCAGRTVADFEEAIGARGCEFEALVGLNDAPTEQPRSRFQAVPAGEFAKGPPPSWFIKGVLPQAALAAIYGQSGAGKSFLALDLTAAIALGQPWRGLKVKQATVAYIVAEGAGGFRGRLAAYEREHNVVLGDAFQVIAGQPNFTKGQDPGEIIAEVERIGAGLVVADTLAQVTPGADENSSEMGFALQQCRRLHERTGAMVILVAHAGKDTSKGIRGWSGIRGALDAEIEVSRSGSARAARITKQKDGQEGGEFGFKLVPVVVGIDDDGDEITSCILREADSPVLDFDGEAIVEALGARAWRADRRSPDWAGLPVAAALGLDSKTEAREIEDLLQRAVFDGLLEQVQLSDNKRNLRPHYRVATVPQ